jgi:transposase
MDVAIGVDSHKATLEVAALDAVGRHLATKRFRNDPRGLDEIVAWVGSFPAKRVVGIECSATFGAALARHLLRSGEDVREVPGNLSHAEAKLTRKASPIPPTPRRSPGSFSGDPHCRRPKMGSTRS